MPLDDVDKQIVKALFNNGRESLTSLKDIILKIELVTKNQIAMQIIEAPGKTVRPLDIIKHIFEMPDIQLKQLRVVKRSMFIKTV